jgi:subfamily B ATP-binding cassette protein MsbA
MKAARIESISSPAMEVFSGIAIALVVWYGGSQVISGHTTTGSFFSFLGALLFAYRPIKSLADLNTSLQEGLAAARRFFQLLDTRPMIIDSPNAKALQIKGGSILIYDVSFSYDGTRALDGLSLNIPAGKTVALVGPSGGGKTTIMRLLLRFFDVQSGSVSIDGQDIRDITLHSLRDAIAVVTQDTILFDDTVMANILYGKLNATKDEVVKAAKMALAHDFIMELPNGYDTMVGQGGAKLSGGQRQRIAIARAILKNSPILLLDEATSSLDNLSEQYIRRSLQALHSHHTILVIAHRLSTVEDADIIYMVDQGKVIEQGTHQELLAKQGKYACLYHCAE